MTRAQLQAVLPPGVADDDQLAQHWSVELWRNRGYREQEEVADLRGVVAQAAQAAARANVLQDTTTAACWGWLPLRPVGLLPHKAARSFTLASARRGDLLKGQILFLNGPVRALPYISRVPSN
eukprot:jgi/Ulvmu1/8473/UM044_0006.1